MNLKSNHPVLKPSPFKNYPPPPPPLVLRSYSELTAKTMNSSTFYCDVITYISSYTEQHKARKRAGTHSLTCIQIQEGSIKWLRHYDH